MFGTCCPTAPARRTRTCSVLTPPCQHSVLTSYPHAQHSVLTRYPHAQPLTCYPHAQHSVLTRYPHAQHSVLTHYPHAQPLTCYPHVHHSVLTRHSHVHHSVLTRHSHAQHNTARADGAAGPQHVDELGNKVPEWARLAVQAHAVEGSGTSAATWWPVAALCHLAASIVSVPTGLICTHERNRSVTHARTHIVHPHRMHELRARDSRTRCRTGSYPPRPNPAGWSRAHGMLMGHCLCKGGAGPATLTATLHCRRVRSCCSRCPHAHSHLLA